MSVLKAFLTFTFISSVLSSDPLLTYKVPLSNAMKLQLGYAEDAVLTFDRRGIKYGYNVENHVVTTEDGYIIRLFRMTSYNCSETVATPVLLMHGTLETADIYLDLGPGEGLAYVLADACFDLWVGNVRGTYYGREHLTLNPDVDAEFWYFTSDEYSLIDLPAQIDYVIAQTGAEKINYVGFSQGGGSIFSLMSENTTYNDKVNVSISIAPATRMTNTRSLGLKLVMAPFWIFQSVLNKIGIQEALFKGSILQTFVEYTCQTNPDGLLFKICENFVFLLDAPHEVPYSVDILRTLYSHFPAGVSTRGIVKYVQAFMSPNFQKYDFGSDEENLAVYGSTSPPIYNLTQVTVPSVIIVGLNDIVADPRDALWVSEQIVNLLELKYVDDVSWNHLDNIYNANATTLVYPTIIDYLLQYS